MIGESWSCVQCRVLNDSTDFPNKIRPMDRPSERRLKEIKRWNEDRRCKGLRRLESSGRSCEAPKA